MKATYILNEILTLDDIEPLTATGDWQELPIPKGVTSYPIVTALGVSFQIAPTKSIRNTTTNTPEPLTLWDIGRPYYNDGNNPLMVKAALGSVVNTEIWKIAPNTEGRGVNV